MELPDRVEAFLGRQIAWLEEVRAELENLDNFIGTDSLDWLIERQRYHNNAIENFTRERQGLLREWQEAAGIAPARRAAVRRRAAKAEMLKEEVLQRYQAAMQLLASGQAECRRQLSALKRGRGNINRFRPGVDIKSEYFDRKA
jgi:hypothetical protein